MTWRRLWTRVVNPFRRGRFERDLDAELRAHLDLHIDENLRLGLSPTEARRAAQVRLGGIEQVKEHCRETWGVALVDQCLRDTRYAMRRLVHDWRFSLLALLILALGIGANTAMFSVVNAMLSGPVTFRDAHQLVNIYQNDPVSGQPLSTPYPVYEDMTGYTDPFQGLTAFSLPVPVRFSVNGIVRPGLAEFATSTYPTVLGLEVPMGRWFTAEEDQPGATPVAVLTHQAWTGKFGAAPSVIGQTLYIDGAAVTVVGIGPEGYNGSFHAGIVTDFWLSIPSIVTVAGRPDMLERDPGEAPFMVKARLRDGVGLPQAQAAMAALGARLAADYPDEDPGRGISVLRSDAVRLHPQFDGVLNYGASVLMILVGLLLAIACSNLATWLLVRGLSRAKEVSVRLALGATRGQIVRYLLVESSLLAGAGGALGCVLAIWTIRLVGLMDLPFDADVGLDERVLGFALLLSLVTGVAFGLAPALRTTHVTLTPALRAEDGALASDRHGLTLRNGLVLAQVVFSCVLLVGAGAQVQRLVRAHTTDLGFDIEDLAFVETDAGFAGYGAEQAATLYETLLDRISRLPGVQSATLAAAPPPVWHGSTRDLVFDRYEPADDEVPLALWTWAGPGYFETLQIPLLYGRSFTDLDRPETPGVTVINERMARQYFGTPNAVGRSFRVNLSRGESEGAPGTELRVIGVVPDVRTSAFDREPRPMFYRSSRQEAAAMPTVVVRTMLDPSSLVQPMQQVLRDLDGGLPVIRARTMSQHLADSLAPQRAAVGVLGGLGGLGLALASLGLYAVMAFAVSRRTREIGIRMALGAQRTRAIWTISRSIATLLAVGVATGLGLSWLLVQGSAAMSSSLSQGGAVSLDVPTADPMTFLLVMGLMVAVGLSAAFFPARRAAHTDPLVGLREL